MRKHKEGEDMNYTISNEKLTLVVSSKGENFSLSKMQKDRNTCGREMLQHGQTEGRIYFPISVE